MKKCIAILLCACSLCALSATALAIQDDTQYWKDLYGIPEPRQEDYEDSVSFTAAWDAWYAGFSSFFISATQSAFAYQAQEEAGRLAEEEEAPVEMTPVKPVESAGSNNGNGSQSMENDASAKYPVGSYVDSAGVVWSPDGTRLSPDVPPVDAPAAGSDEGSALTSPYAADPVDLPVFETSEALTLVTSSASESAADQPIWYVEDLRPADAPATALEGLKSLVTSIFGEYTPVTTTSVITETVGNETRQYLVESVAPGAAGVDYEWLAGVFLFGILLFCFMKLLGGVLK